MYVYIDCGEDGCTHYQYPTPRLPPITDCTAHFMPSADLHAIAADVFGCFTGTNVVEGAKTPSNLDVSAAPHSDDL